MIGTCSTKYNTVFPGGRGPAARRSRPSAHLRLAPLLRAERQIIVHCLPERPLDAPGIGPLVGHQIADEHQPAVEHRVLVVVLHRAGMAPVRDPRGYVGPSSIDTRVCLGPSLNYSRSEEHTSELQSLMRNSYAVFFLKKKITT